MSRLTDEDSPLPVTYVTQSTFAALPEYSYSLPTGTTAGKMWKAHKPYRRPATCVSNHDCGHWLLGQYVESADPKMMDIVWKRLRVLADLPPLATGREPREPTFQQLPLRTDSARQLRAAAVRHVWTPEED